MDTLNCIENELQRLSISLNTPAPTEILGEVINITQTLGVLLRNKPI